MGVLACVLCSVFVGSLQWTVGEAAGAGDNRKVLLISMDGFRWDYIKKANTPNFDDFAAKGTRADYINNTFITKTFPCHYSIATGSSYFPISFD